MSHKSYIVSVRSLKQLIHEKLSI